MNELQSSIVTDFIKEDKSNSFTGWTRSLIIGYYEQWYFERLTEEEIGAAIDEACKQLRVSFK